MYKIFSINFNEIIKKTVHFFNKKKINKLEKLQNRYIDFEYVFYIAEISKQKAVI